MINYQNKVLVYFGNADNPLDKIKKEFPSLAFKTVKQTHSDIVVKASDSVIEADAHFTSEPFYALLVSTADCLPIMIYCRQTSRVASVHAGWRGVENKIVEKVLQRLIETGSSERNFIFWIGPHITQESFATDFPVYSLLSHSHYNLIESDYVKTVNTKFFISLKKIIESQITHVLKVAPEIVCSEVDTKSDASYFSHRRDPHNNGRNLSFICLLN